MSQTDILVVGHLINHSSDPNHTAKIILIEGQKKIAIYAKVDVQPDDEVTYDYDFPIEDERVCTNRFPSYHVLTASIRLRVFAVEPNIEDSSII
jgi:SET domain-containing protein